MIVQVVVDKNGKVMGAMAKGVRSEDAVEITIREAHPEHSVHEVDIPEEVFLRTPGKFCKHLQDSVRQSKKG